MANNVIKRVWNQNRMVQIEDLQGMIFQAESGGHTFQISGVDDDGNSVALSGTVGGVFLRPDNTDVAIVGSASGGAVSVTLPSNCYEVPGRFGLTIFVTYGEQKTAVYAAVGTVSRTSGGSVSPETAADVTDLINAIAAAVASIPASYTEVMGAIASTYSNTSVYPAGAYVWYDGELYKSKVAITTAESWTPSHWEQAVFGNDFTVINGAVSDLYVPTLETLEWSQGYITSNGSIGTAYDSCYSDMITSDGRPIVVSAHTGHKVKVAEYNPAGTFDEMIVALSAGEHTFIVPYGWKYRIQISVDSGALSPNDAPGAIDYMISGMTDKTLLEEGKAADAKATGERIEQEINKAALKDIINRFDKTTITDGKYININDGSLSSASGFFASDFIYIGDLYEVTLSYTHLFGWYDANKNWLGHPDAMDSSQNDKTYEIPSNAVYLRFSTYSDYLNKAQVGFHIDRNNYLQNSRYNLPELFLPNVAYKDTINRFDSGTIFEGKYINQETGGLVSYSGFFASDYIYVGDLSSVTLSYSHIFGWYDENRAWIGHPDNMDSISTDRTYSVPSGAKYLRFSSYNDYLGLAQVGNGIARSNYINNNRYKLSGLIVGQDQVDSSMVGIVVNKSGGGDYTSLVQALYENVSTPTSIKVMPGTYDIKQEYIDLFGQSAVESMSDADSAIFHGFQFGAIIRSKTIEFVAGSHVVCDWTGLTIDGTHRFCAFRIDYNSKLIGLDLVATATFYAIHDDNGPDGGMPYTVEYENCRVIGANLGNSNCIGGGCKMHSRHILKNCYFSNGTESEVAVRYHNTNGAGSEPEIFVSNCYFGSSFAAMWYGSQTSKMRVYVNNCHARSIFKMQESSDFNVDNVELYKWCNTETNLVN